MSDVNGARMPSWSLRSLTSSSRVASIKEYVNQADYKHLLQGRHDVKPGDVGYVEGQHKKQSWKQWAGDKLRAGKSGSPVVREHVALFPGWATRRFVNGPMGSTEAPQFSLDVFVSGYASAFRPGSSTRSQRAFMRVAKAYASLPKLPTLRGQAEDRPALSRSTEDLLAGKRLPPRPTEITEESEIQALEQQFRRADDETSSVSSSGSDQSNPLSSSSSFSWPNDRGIDDLKRLHANLTARLLPFWSSALGTRVVRLSLYTSPPTTEDLRPMGDKGRDAATLEPVAIQDVVTSPEGGFQTRFNVPWERICQQPASTEVAFGHPEEEHEVYLVAELLPAAGNARGRYGSQSVEPSSQTPESIVKSTLEIPISQAPVRLISDIDDTIKLSNILGGARAIFRNVFVRHLEELVIQGMGEWYTDMWRRGVRFHYVSNGPFELLPVVNDFLKISSLPKGSIKMKSYAGRSLFTGLLSAPANRKRDGVIDILDAFNFAQFFLVGDTGEQDLELYTALAAERSRQILAVFVRDARPPEETALDDPTGERVEYHGRFGTLGPAGRDTHGIVPSEGTLITAGTGPSLNEQPPTPTQQSVLRTPCPEQTDHITAPRPYRTQSASATYATGSSSTVMDPSFMASRSPTLPTPMAGYDNPEWPNQGARPRYGTPPLCREPQSVSPAPAEMQAQTSAERRRYELQMRVYRARLIIPKHIPLRVFREPEDCVEAREILQRVGRVRETP